MTQRTTTLVPHNAPAVSTVAAVSHGFSLPQSGDMLRPEEIGWTLRPVERREDDNLVDVFGLSPAELIAYALSLQDDIRALRTVAHSAVEKVSELSRILRVRDQTIIRLREEVRAAA